jgi:hypothetical protein
LRRQQPHLGGAHFATRQGTKPELELHRAGADLRLVPRCTDGNVAQLEPRRRQDARVDRAIDPNGESSEAARFFLERGAILAPIDDKRSDQRRDERQNNGYGHSEQRRLHGKASLLIAKRFRACPASKASASPSGMHAPKRRK